MIIVLYPELVDYIYQFCDRFKTSDEKLAGKTILYNQKGLNDKITLFIKSKGWYSDEQHIREMLKDGYDEFKIQVATRIYNEHKDELNLIFAPSVLK